MPVSRRDGRLVYARESRAVSRAKALLAAADSLETTYDLTRGNPVERSFYRNALALGYKEFNGGHWPCEAEMEYDTGEVIAKDEHHNAAVFALDDGTHVFIVIDNGWCHVTVASKTREGAAGAVAAFSAKYPPLYRAQDDGGLIPVTFWTNGPFGPTSRLRMVDSADWQAIEDNYTGAVRAQLAGMMHDFEPGKSGQLILWQGSPGTGKTWALRALASEWGDWAEFHYITDPDAFFVTNPSYMIDVLLHESYEEIALVDGDPEIVSTDRLGKWRVLILEDTGELLAANAKESYGQGLSRLLNVVDGLVGQGLRVLVLVTTNDELGDLHPAVSRPGRCAAQIEFAPLTAEEATVWLGEPVEEPATVAELYAQVGVGKPAFAADEQPDVMAELARVAEEHAPDGGYGDTYWRASDGSVFWVAADWSTGEELDAAWEAFFEVEGVKDVEVCAECAAPGEGWEQVWPEAVTAAAPTPGKVDYDFLTPRLATGALLDGPADVDALVEAGITHIIDLTDAEDDTEFLGDSKVSVLYNPTRDDGRQKPDKWFQDSLDFAEEALAIPHAKVYAHCSAGVNRGPSTAYLILRAYGMPEDMARKIVTDARPKAELGYADQADDFLTREVFTRRPVALSAAAALGIDPDVAELVELARAELPELDEPAEFALEDGMKRALDALHASGTTSRESLTATLMTIMDAHRCTVDAMTAALTASGTAGTGAHPEVISMMALEVLQDFARRPPPAQGDVHVHVPQHDLSVHVDAPEINPQIDVHVPAQAPQPAPVVNVDIPQQPAPVVHIAPAQAPDVHVTVEAPEAPDVHVTVEPPAPAPARAVRVEVDDEGVKRYIPETE